MKGITRAREMEERVTYADLRFPPAQAPPQMKQLPWRCAALSLALLFLLLLLVQTVLVGLSFHFLGQLSGCTYDPWSTEEPLSYGQQTLQGQCQFCPAGWVWDAGHCYYFSSAKKTWEQSKEDCCSREAHLATIRTNSTLVFLARMSGVDVFYVGLKRDSLRADWKWLDGTRLKGLFPVQRVTSSFLACGRVSGSGLSSGPCGEAHGWVCETRALPLQRLPSSPAAFLWGNTTYTCVKPW